MSDTASAAALGQPQFGRGINEGIQYEIFCGDRYFCVRVIETGSLKYHCSWVYDGGVRELLSSETPLRRSAKPHLDLSGDDIRIEADKSGGKIGVKSPAGDLEIDFKSPITASWGIPPEDVAIHQPLMDATVRWGGQSLRGQGYCKRYWYHRDIDYWSWRFIMGIVQQGAAPLMVWTAEAMFALEKYDYFKLVGPNGAVAAAERNDSLHREAEAFGTVNGVAYNARVRELGRWEKVLRTSAMDTKLRLKFCELSLISGGTTLKGYALHEIGAGTSR